MAAPEDELRSHLDPREKLLWAGRPAQRIVLTREVWYFIPLSVVWLGIVGFIFWAELNRKTPDRIALFVTACMLAFGIYIFIGRFVADLWSRSRLIYGVTDRRAIVLSGVRRRSVQSIYLSSVSSLKLEERRDRSGTIYFGDQPSSSYWHGDTWKGAGAQFIRIADANEVYTILHEAMQRQKK